MIYQSGIYKAVVKDDNTVDVYEEDILIDYPGPWDTYEGACLWASEIVVALDDDEAIIGG